MAFKTTANINLQAVSARQDITSLFQIPSLLLVSQEVATLTGVLAINEIRDFTDALTLITNAPASTIDPDTGLNFIAIKADNPFEVSLTFDGTDDIYSGVPGLIYLQVFNQSTAVRVKHVKLKAGSAAVQFLMMVGHSPIVT